MSGTLLDAVLEAVRRRAAARRRMLGLARLEEHVKPDSWRRERVLTALSKPELAFVCEVKRTAPWAGVLLAEDDDPRRYAPSRLPRIGPRWQSLAAALRAGGADMLSVATGEDHFGGSLEDLRTVEFTRLPRLRRDYVLDECMVLEGSVYGADAVTLVAAVLDDATLAGLRALAREYGIAVVVEFGDERGLERALAVEPEVVAACPRDPRTLAVDRSAILRLLPRVPAGPLRAAAGGIRGIEDLRRVRAAGAQVVIVGSALSAAPDPAALLASWRDALRAAEGTPP
ncbi:MAG: hypothetical protein JNK02_16450 [Planctomycetes bacterium]|nr:hypothetical protein [Planctomycetota bacterium]